MTLDLDPILPIHRDVFHLLFLVFFDHVSCFLAIAATTITRILN